MADYDYILSNDWGDANHWASGSVPAATGEHIAVGEHPSSAITGGLDTGGDDYDVLHILPSCTVPVGTPASPLVAGAGILTCESQAPFYFNCDNNGAAVDVNDCRITMAESTIPCILGSDLGNAGDYDQIVVNRGNVTLAGNMLFGSCRLEVGRVSSGTDATVMISPSAAGDTLPTIYQTSGTVTSHVIVTTLTLMGGKFTQNDAVIASIEVGPGAMFIYKNAGTSALPLIRVYPGGTIDFSQSVNEATIGEAWYHEGSTVIGSTQNFDRQAAGGGQVEGLQIYTLLHDMGANWKRRA